MDPCAHLCGLPHGLRPDSIALDGRQKLVRQEGLYFGEVLVDILRAHCPVKIQLHNGKKGKIADL